MWREMRSGNHRDYPLKVGGDVMQDKSFCDNCGDELLTPDFRVYQHVPYDTASAYAGESAIVCADCDGKLKAKRAVEV